VCDEEGPHHSFVDCSASSPERRGRDVFHESVTVFLPK
jgi:hypothetical protein